MKKWQLGLLAGFSLSLWAGCIFDDDKPSQRAPRISKPQNKTVREGQALVINLIVSDPDGDKVTVTVKDLPAGATFYDNTLTWATSYESAGQYKVTLVASTADGMTDTETVAITVEDVITVLFAKDVQPIFDKYCVECHADRSTPGNVQTGPDSTALDLRAPQAWSRLVNVPTYQFPAIKPKFRVLPWDPDDSYLMQKMDTLQAPKGGHHMPVVPPRLDTAEMRILRTWIREGALNN